MTMRRFLSEDGTLWRVWRVASSEEHIIAANPGHASEWLAFQDPSGAHRRRLFDFPRDWDELPETQLETLRARAEPVRAVLRRRPRDASQGERTEQRLDA